MLQKILIVQSKFQQPRQPLFSAPCGCLHVFTSIFERFHKALISPRCFSLAGTQTKGYTYCRFWRSDHFWDNSLCEATFKNWKKHNHIRGVIKSHWSQATSTSWLIFIDKVKLIREKATTHNNSTGPFMCACMREAEWLNRWTGPAHRMCTLSLWVCLAVVSEAPTARPHFTTPMTHHSSWSLRCTGACGWLTQVNSPHLICFFCCFLLTPHHLFFLSHLIKDSVCLQVPNSSPIFSSF